MRKKVLVLFLTLSMVLSFMPVIAFADAEEEGSAAVREAVAEQVESVQDNVEAEVAADAAEPVEEAAADEESEEADFQQPVRIHALYAEDGEEECAHENAYTEDKIDWDSGEVTYESIDDRQHKAKGPGNRITYCDDCESVIESIPLDSVEEVEHHNYEDGFCKECKHTNNCEHKNTSYSYKWDPEKVTYTVVDNIVHRVKGPGVRETLCDDCGETIKRGENVTIDSEFYHNYDENEFCKYCKHTNTCKHPSTYFEYDYDTDECEIDDTGDGKHHTVRGKITKYTYCKECEECIEEKELGLTTVTEIHYFNEEDVCRYCNFTKKCIHEFDAGIVTEKPTCTKEGVKTYTCSKCNEQKTETIEALGHSFGEWIEVESSTCEGGGALRRTCKTCGFTETKASDMSGHEWDDDYTVDVEATCTADGSASIHCKKCNATKESKVIPALGHDWSEPEWTWSDDHQSATAKFTCKRDATHVETVNAKEVSVSDASGDKTVYTAKVVFNGKEYKDSFIEKKPQKSDERLYGNLRYDTAIAAAEKYKETTGSKFENVIVAYGLKFPDALSGGYLAKVTNAPILLVEPSVESRIVNYISENISSDGTVYILGGTGVVRSAFESALVKKGLKTKRLGGPTRFDTNLEILKAAGVTDEDILVCTGYEYADSLSASAVGKPILLVGNTLTEGQIAYIKGLNSKQYYLIGGEGAVKPTIEKGLKALKELNLHIERLWGSTRYETSTAVAKKFFEKAKTVVLAYAQNFPDGLSGGPLAMLKDAPIVLTHSNITAAAKDYVKNAGIVNSITLGGPKLISDTAVKIIMGR